MKETGGCVWESWNIRVNIALWWYLPWISTVWFTSMHYIHRGASTLAAHNCKHVQTISRVVHFSLCVCVWAGGAVVSPGNICSKEGFTVFGATQTASLFPAEASWDWVFCDVCVWPMAMFLHTLGPQTLDCQFWYVIRDRVSSLRHK